MTTTATTTPATAAPLTVRHAVVDFLRRTGMTTIFGNPGSTELALFLDFPEDFRYVLGLQEAVVVGMADGHAQATRNAAFVNLHSAAGVGHAMGNIFSAFKNRTPLVITAGQQSRSILPFDPFLFSSQATELPKPYVKWSIEPARAEDVPLAIARAYYLAMQPPCGPVLVSIPADDWDKPAELLPERAVSTRLGPDPAMIDKIGDALDGSRTPAFVVGSAIDRDSAWDAVVQLAERHNARVFMAPMSGRAGFPQDHRLFAGFLPAMREKIVGGLAGHDTVLVIGAPAFAYHVEGFGPHVPPGTTLCQIIDDPTIASWAPEGVSAVCSIGLGVQALLARPAPAARALPAARVEPPRAEPSPLMSVAFLLQTLNEVREPTDVIVEESPSARPVMHRYLPVLRAETFYTMDSGGLGWAMPAAVGVALGKPEARVICLIGDGSSMYSIQSLWSAAQGRCDITFIVVNNQRYAALQEFAPVFGFKPDDKLEGTALPNIDFVGLAKAQGCDGIRVTEASELAGVLRTALATRGPKLVEVVVA